MTAIATVVKGFFLNQNYYRTSTEVSLPMLVCRLKFQTELNLSPRKKFLKLTLVLWFSELRACPGMQLLFSADSSFQEQRRSAGARSAGAWSAGAWSAGVCLVYFTQN